MQLWIVNSFVYRDVIQAAKEVTLEVHFEIVIINKEFSGGRGFRKLLVVGDQGGDCDQAESWGSGLCSYQDFNYFRSLFAPEMKTSTILILFTLAGVAANHNTLFHILILMISIKLTKLTIIRWSTSSPSPWPSRIVAGSFSRTGDSDLFIVLNGPKSHHSLALWLTGKNFVKIYI